jgi:hypothetical protein
VTEVERSIEGAHDLWNSYLDPTVNRAGSLSEKSKLRTWVLPYSCIILLCESTIHLSNAACLFLVAGSHKKRDNRCGIAAPKLEHGLYKPGSTASLTDIIVSLHSLIRTSRLGC